MEGFSRRIKSDVNVFDLLFKTIIKAKETNQVQQKTALAVIAVKDMQYQAAMDRWAAKAKEIGEANLEKEETKEKGPSTFAVILGILAVAVITIAVIKFAPAGLAFLKASSMKMVGLKVLGALKKVATLKALGVLATGTALFTGASYAIGQDHPFKRGAYIIQEKVKEFLEQVFRTLIEDANISQAKAQQIQNDLQRDIQIDLSAIQEANQAQSNVATAAVKMYQRTSEEAFNRAG